MTDTQDHYEPYDPDDTDDEEYGEAEAGGTTDPSLSLPDESPNVEITAKVRKQVSDEIERERKQIAQAAGTVVKVSTNISGAVLFQSYGIGNTVQPTQIAREKPERGDLVIVNYTDGVPIYIGLHAGIMPGGSDTVRIVGSSLGTARVIRTRQALWAVASTVCTVDVQEEFN